MNLEFIVYLFVFIFCFAFGAMWREAINIAKHLEKINKSLERLVDGKKRSHEARSNIKSIGGE